jgi:transmembrane sensor
MAKPSPNTDDMARWLNQQELPEVGSEHEDLRPILHAPTRWQVPQKRSKEEAWALLQEKLKEEPATAPPVRSIRPLLRWLSAAAVALLLAVAGLWYFSQPQEASLITQRAQQKTNELPDGSRVMLNAESQLSYNEERGGIRRLRLQGEAFFEVVEGKPFVVETPQGKVRVLGTSFNVYARPGGWEVACFSGKVQVETPGQPVRELEAGQALNRPSPDADDLVVVSFDKGKTASWQKGKFYFENEPLFDVIAVIERQFDVEIEATGLEQKAYSGFFSNQHLDSALRMVCRPLGLTSTQVEGSYILLRQAADIDEDP